MTNKHDFRISAVAFSDGVKWYCTYQPDPYDALTIRYLRKDGKLYDNYDGNFFNTATEAATFLDEYLSPTRLSRAEIAEKFEVEADFILVD